MNNTLYKKKDHLYDFQRYLDLLSNFKQLPINEEAVLNILKVIYLDGKCDYLDFIGLEKTTIHKEREKAELKYCAPTFANWNNTFYEKQI